MAVINPDPVQGAALYADPSGLDPIDDLLDRRDNGTIDPEPTECSATGFAKVLDLLRYCVAVLKTALVGVDTTGVQDGDTLVYDEDTQTWKPGEAAGSGGLPMNYFTGFEMANNVSDPDYDVDVSIGAAKDSTNAVDITLASAITKRLDAAWAAGTGNGMMDNISDYNSNLWFHLFAIKNSSTGAVDILASLSPSAPTMPTGYDYKIRIGSVRTGATAKIRAFSQLGPVISWVDQSVDFNSTAPSSPAALTVLVPSGVVVWAIMRTTCSTASQTYYVNNYGQTGVSQIIASGGGVYSAEGRAKTNTSSQVYHSGSAAGVNGAAVTNGWVEIRR